MSENIQVAQSYAKAVYEMCSTPEQASEWSNQLAFLTQVVENQDMHRFLADIARPSEERTRGFMSVVTDELSPSANNLVRLLGENGRLALMPEIAAQYELLRAAAEQRMTATVVSAFPLTESETNNIKTALHKRLNRTIDLITETDNSLIAGAIVRAGDLVIDGSMRGGVQKLATQLSR